MLIAKTEMSASTISDKGYVYGGATNFNTNSLADCDEYNSISNVWTSKQALPSPTRQEATGSTILEKGYVYGGQTADGAGQARDCDEYNPITNSWASKLDIPVTTEARSSAASTTI